MVRLFCFEEDKEGTMGRSEESQIRRDIRNNRNKIKSYEYQISGKDTVLQTLQEDLRTLQSAIGNLDTVISNVQGINKYYIHVFFANTGTTSQWRGETYQKANSMVTESDHEFIAYCDAVATMKEQMEEKKIYLQHEIRAIESEIQGLQESIFQLQNKNMLLQNTLYRL